MSVLSSRVLSATIAKTDDRGEMLARASERMSRKSAELRSKSGWPFPVIKAAGADTMLIFEAPS